MTSPKGASFLFVFMVSVFVWWWCEQSGLRCLRESAGAVCLVTFAGKTVSVLPGLSCQGECVGDKGKLVLRYRQAAGAFRSHGFKRKNQVRGAMNGPGCRLQHGQALRF